MLTRLPAIAVAVITAFLVTGCGSSTVGAPGSGKSNGLSAKSSAESRRQEPVGEASGPNRCALLTDDEVSGCDRPARPWR